MIISRAFLINGTSQWLYLNLHSEAKADSRSEAKPTLLFLHGGPGWADAPWAGIICKNLWDKFNIVHWDQRGSNRSTAKNLDPGSQALSPLHTQNKSQTQPHSNSDSPAESQSRTGHRSESQSQSRIGHRSESQSEPQGQLKGEEKSQSQIFIDTMIQDGFEVCRILREEFQIHRPILVGHSWGAFLGAHMASQAPELFHSLIGIGLLVANRESEPISLIFCQEKARELGRQDLEAELMTMSPDFYRSVPTLFRQREIVAELGGEFKVPVSEEQWKDWILRSPSEYRNDLRTIYEGCAQVCVELWPQLIERNLMNEVSRLDLPVTLFQGINDYCTPMAPVNRWFKALSCNRKKMIQFDHSAHWPQIEENEKFSQLVLRLAGVP